MLLAKHNYYDVVNDDIVMKYSRDKKGVHTEFL
jgi:hypothetical protein